MSDQEMKKCAHAGCQCMAPKGEKYCSTYCQDAKDVTTLECECGHPACERTAL